MEAVVNEIKMEKYPAYKDSGVEWLGEIPEHWEAIKFKYLFNEINERSFDGSEDLLSVSQYTGVTLKKDKIEDGDLLTTAETLEGYKKVYKGDLVTNIMLAWNGSLGFSPFNGITSPAYSIYRLTGINSTKYFHYLLRTDLYKAEFKRNSTGVIESRLRLYTDDFFKILSLLPPVEEQTAIANFLDHKTAQIDKAIAQKEKLIELLKERRQILIHNAVTRGLNPDVRMKDSGVEWIGKIPEGWRSEKLKYHFKLIGGGTPSKERVDFWNGDIPWVSPKDMKLDYISESEDRISLKGLKQSATNMIPQNTLLMVVRSGILQRNIPVAISQVNLSINQDLKAFFPIGSVLSEFLFFFIKGCDAFLRNEWVKQVATVESIEIPIMNNYWILIPPPNEQKEIISFIQSIAEKIINIIILQEKEIEKLKEFKATLVNAVVTGKIKVSEATKHGRNE